MAGTSDCEGGLVSTECDTNLARALARQAGELLVTTRDEEQDARLLRRRGDTESHEWLMRSLKEQRPDDAVLSEEGVDGPARLGSNRVWIIDPLDGTREYSEPPRDDWAVHVALWQRGELTDGAVALPARGVVFDTRSFPQQQSRSGAMRLAVSRTRPPAFVTQLAAHVGADLVPMGSAGVKAMAVLGGTADAYVHAGGQYEWDSAAPVAVAHAAGLHTSRIDGSRLEYNRRDPRLPDLLICRPEMAAELLAAIASLTREDVAS